jgi:hypothetical protein
VSGILADPRAASIAGVLLALPFTTLFTMFAVLHIEPPLGPLEPLVTAPVDQPNVVGTAIVLGAWLLAVVAFVVSVGPVVRSARAGNGIAADPINLAVAAAILVVVVSFVGGIIVDQYPCWIGVPNCD